MAIITEEVVISSAIFCCRHSSKRFANDFEGPSLTTLVYIHWISRFGSLFELFIYQRLIQSNEIQSTIASLESNYLIIGLNCDHNSSQSPAVYRRQTRLYFSIQCCHYRRHKLFTPNKSRSPLKCSDRLLRGRSITSIASITATTL